jgi:hypothetical protein
MMAGKQLSSRNITVEWNNDTVGCDLHLSDPITEHSVEQISATFIIEIINIKAIETNDTVRETADSHIINPEISSERTVISVK